MGAGPAERAVGEELALKLGKGFPCGVALIEAPKWQLQVRLWVWRHRETMGAVTSKTGTMQTEDMQRLRFATRNYQGTRVLVDYQDCGPSLWDPEAADHRPVSTPKSFFHFAWFLLFLKTLEH